MSFSKVKYGIFSFIIVLLLMPIGHALMVLTERFFHTNMLLAAFGIGIAGTSLVFLGIVKDQNKKTATLLGLLGGILVWTGWVEFSFVWIAQKLNVSPLMENGEVATKPEYLVMMSSLGLLSVFTMFFLSSQTRCQFFSWFQKVFGIKVRTRMLEKAEKFIAVTTFIETIMILWMFYIVLLLVYDNDIAGSNHPITYVVAFGSLFWSIYLFLRLIKIQEFDYAIRYAVPTVIIFWNFVEVMGRWDLLNEIWVEPTEYVMEVSIIFALFFAFTWYYVKEIKEEKKLHGRKKSYKDK
ncbi:MAG: hypothetical protein QF383_07625 [Flavobacteriales bacterium]|jgi:hypothetical protein|nr:hypothetical protein [Flavobacteriales bacterium]